MKIDSSLELLESRIAPAKLLSLVDVDGDLISITTTKGTDAQLLAVVSKTNPAGAVPGGVAISEINLADNLAAFDGASITVTARRGPLGGDGLVNVGAIIAAGLDLGSVTVKGDLAELYAGKNTPASKVAAISVNSATGSPVWQLDCSVGSLTVKTNVTTTEIRVTGASLGKLTIGGSLIGTDGVAASGYIHVDNGTLGKVTIGGSIVGAVETNSGRLAAKSITSVTVGGSLIGGGGSHSGEIIATDPAGSLGPVVVKGDVRGTGADSGRIESKGTLGAVTIGGSVLGGGSDAGAIFGDKGIGQVKIGHDLVGDGAHSGIVDASAGSIAGVTIGGSVVGGSESVSGAILADGNIGPVVIRGDLRAGPDVSAVKTGIISAQIGTTSDANFASIASITIGGSVIGGGANDNGQIFADGNLGPVKIGGDLRGGSGAGSGEINTVGTLGLLTISGSVIGSSGSGSGSVATGGRMAGVNIGGSLVGGSANSAGALHSNVAIGAVSIRGDFIGSPITLAGTITSGGTLGAITIARSVLPGGGGSARISAGNDAMLNLGTNLLIKSVTVAGSATQFVVEGTRADGIIGPVKVGGDWTRGRITSGISPGDSYYGDGNDSASGVGDPDLFSKIASITIGGAVVGTTASGDNFGFVAQEIGALTIAGVKIPLRAGHGNDTDLSSRYIISATRDFSVHEVA
jgi:hypothetical protein